MAILYIKNMVCNRCVTAVTDVFEKLGLTPEKVTLGEVVVAEDKLNADLLQKIDQELLSLGFERIDDRKGRLVESIKNKVIAMIHEPKAEAKKMNWSDWIAEELHYDYNYLSNLFSSMEGITLEQYVIRQKIERVKELLFYDELNLSQIANELGYSSVAHLSAQFKKITGLTPSELKKARGKNELRKPLDAVK
jgi:AraC family transcriptional regulator